MFRFQGTLVNVRDFELKGWSATVLTEVAAMRDSFEVARTNINRDAMLRALGECLRVECARVEESLPERLAGLIKQLEQTISDQGE
jgi:hypothetical protein